MFALAGRLTAQVEDVPRSEYLARRLPPFPIHLSSDLLAPPCGQDTAEFDCKSWPSSAGGCYVRPCLKCEPLAGTGLIQPRPRQRGHCCGALASTRFCGGKWSDWSSVGAASVCPPPALTFSLVVLVLFLLSFT